MLHPRFTCLFPRFLRSSLYHAFSVYSAFLCIFRVFVFTALLRISRISLYIPCFFYIPRLSYIPCSFVYNAFLRIFYVSLYIPRFSYVPRSSVYPAFLRIFRVSVSPFHHFIIFMISSLNHSIISSFHVSSSFHCFIILWWFLRSVDSSFHHYLWWFHRFIFHRFIISPFFFVRNAHATLNWLLVQVTRALFTSTSAAHAVRHSPHQK